MEQNDSTSNPLQHSRTVSYQAAIHKSENKFGLHKSENEFGLHKSENEFGLHKSEKMLHICCMARLLRSLRQVATLRHGHMARRFAPAFRAPGVYEHS